MQFSNIRNNNMRKTQIKKTKLLTLITFIFFSQVAFSQIKSAQTPMIKGWEGLTWESTETDLKQKYGNQLTVLEKVSKYGNDEYYCPLFKIMKLIVMTTLQSPFFLMKRQRNLLEYS